MSALMLGGSLMGAHLYLSTACLHGVHGMCGQVQGGRGEVGPPHCKYCPEVCLCPVCRHVEPVGRRMARGVYSGYRSQRVHRLHVIKDEWAMAATPVRARTAVLPVGSQTLCGQGARGTLKAAMTAVDPLPLIPPAGLTWCPPCVGLLAEAADAIAMMALILAASGVPVTDTP